MEFSAKGLGLRAWVVKGLGLRAWVVLMALHSGSGWSVGQYLS